MDEFYEWLNPRIPVEYVLLFFLVLSVAIVIGMLVMKGGEGEEICAWGFACGILLPGALFYCDL